MLLESLSESEESPLWLDIELLYDEEDESAIQEGKSALSWRREADTGTSSPALKQGSTAAAKAAKPIEIQRNCHFYRQNQDWENILFWNFLNSIFEILSTSAMYISIMHWWNRIRLSLLILSNEVTRIHKKDMFSTLCCQCSCTGCCFLSSSLLGYDRYMNHRQLKTLNRPEYFLAFFLNLDIQCTSYHMSDVI